jgi:hypothetical protein
MFNESLMISFNFWNVVFDDIFGRYGMYGMACRACMA